MRRVLAVVALIAAGLPVTAAEASPGLRWSVDDSPFRLEFFDGPRRLISQAAGDTAGPSGRMAYQVADGSTHRLTNLVSSKRDRGATIYTVATDEAARTAKVIVRSSSADCAWSGASSPRQE